MIKFVRLLSSTSVAGARIEQKSLAFVFNILLCSGPFQSPRLSLAVLPRSFTGLTARINPQHVPILTKFERRNHFWNGFHNFSIGLMKVVASYTWSPLAPPLASLLNCCYCDDSDSDDEDLPALDGEEPQSEAVDDDTNEADDVD